MNPYNVLSLVTLYSLSSSHNHLAGKKSLVPFHKLFFAWKEDSLFFIHFQFVCGINLPFKIQIKASFFSLKSFINFILFFEKLFVLTLFNWAKIDFLLIKEDFRFNKACCIRFPGSGPVGTSGEGLAFCRRSGPWCWLGLSPTFHRTSKVSILFGWHPSGWASE